MQSSGRNSAENGRVGRSALQCILQRHKRKHRRDTDTEERLPFLGNKTFYQKKNKKIGGQNKTFYKKTKTPFFVHQNGNAIRHYFPLTDYFSPQTAEPHPQHQHQPGRRAPLTCWLYLLTMLTAATFRPCSSPPSSSSSSSVLSTDSRCARPPPRSSPDPDPDPDPGADADPGVDPGRAEGPGGVGGGAGGAAGGVGSAGGATGLSAQNIWPSTASSHF